MKTLSKETLEDIAYSLDRIDRIKGKQEYWRLLIPLLPKESYRYNRIDVEELAYVGTKGGSPSLKLLQDFQKKGMELSYFIALLKKIGCHGALDCLNKQPSKF